MIVAAALAGVCTDCAKPIDEDLYRFAVHAPYGWCRDCAQERGLRQCGEDGRWLAEGNWHEWQNDSIWSWWCEDHACIADTGCDCIQCAPERWCLECRYYQLDMNGACPSCLEVGTTTSV
jgi:hypothetical protein